MAPRKKTATIDATAEEVTVTTPAKLPPDRIQLPALSDANIREIVVSAEKMEATIVAIETAARAFEPGDMSVKKNQEAIGGLMLRVSQTKTPIVEAAEKIKKPLQEKIATVNANLNKLNSRVAALRSELDKPRVEWNAAEEARVAAIDRLIERLEQLGECSDESGNAISPREAKKILDAEVIDERYGEKDGVAANARFAALHKVGQRIEAEEAAAAAEEQRKREAAEHAAELEKARQEAAELAKVREKELQEAAERDAELAKVKAQLEAALAAQRAPAAPQAVEEATKAAPATLTNPANEITDPSPDELKAEHDDEEGPITEMPMPDRVADMEGPTSGKKRQAAIDDLHALKAGEMLLCQAREVIDAIINGQIRYVFFDD